MEVLCLIPFVSFVIPAYNMESYIAVALESLKKQTLRPLEIIVVDDGSTDNTTKVATDVLSNSDLMWKIIVQENRGVSVARNVGISKCLGEYICFLDADDYVNHSFAEKLYVSAKKFDCDMVFCKYNMISSDGKLVKSYDEVFNQKILQQLSLEVVSGKQILEEYMRFNIDILMGNALYKKGMLMEKNISFTPGCKRCEDREFIFKALMCSRKVIFVPEAVSFYVQHTKSVTHNNNDNSEVLNHIHGAFKRMEEFLKSEGNERRLEQIYQKYRNNYFRWTLTSVFSANPNISIDQMVETFIKYARGVGTKTFRDFMLRMMFNFFPPKLLAKVISKYYSRMQVN